MKVIFSSPVSDRNCEVPLYYVNNCASNTNNIGVCDNVLCFGYTFVDIVNLCFHCTYVNYNIDVDWT